MDIANVLVHGTRVGDLRRLNEWEDFRFSFDPQWVADPNRPELGQLFIDRRPKPIETSGLLCWFAHLMPGGPWRHHLQRWAKLDLEDDDDFALLVAIGHDLPGAVTLEPAVASRSGALYDRRPEPPEGAHLKNWSLLYPDRRHPRLSPAYDLVSTVAYRPGDDLALSLNGARSFQALDASAFDGIARLIGRQAADVRQHTIQAWQRVIDVWHAERGQFDLKDRERARIDAHIDGLSLFS